MRTVRLAHHIVFSCLLALSGLLAVSPVDAQIGFQAEPHDSVRVVSWYEPLSYDFSAAMVPKSYPPLLPALRYTPSVVRSSFDSTTMTFNTRYYGGYEMVPVTVNARDYYEYRQRKIDRESLTGVASQNLAAARRQRGAEGLNIGFDALPKRFDKIFGEGGANLKITGYRRITFSGRSQWTDGAESDLFRQNKFPSLQMEQVSRFNITGTIGSKITVSVSQDNQTDIPLENRLQIRYKGDDDDILKSIEAGNTNLRLPNTRFVGYSSRIQGLFGLKAEAQVGNLSLTAIASQEKGSTEKASIDATGEANAVYIRDSDYQSRRMYDAGFKQDRLPASLIGTGVDTIGKYDKITELYVYEQEQRDRDPAARDAVLLVDPLSDPGESWQNREVMTVVQLEYPTTYLYYSDNERNQHYIYFTSRRQSNRARGIYMILERYDGPDQEIPTRVDTVGNITGDTLVLKTIHAGIGYDPSHPTWNLMWRNIYSVPKNLDITEIDMKVFKAPRGREGTTDALEYQKNAQTGQSEGFYLEILGIDQYNRQGRKIPDNLVDDRLEIYRQDWGLLIFPLRQPFAPEKDTVFTSETGQTTAPLEDQVPTLYDYTSTSDLTKATKYYIQYVTRSRSSQINLNRVNIIEGSEVVMVNGRQLERGTGYTVQYDFGQITLLDPEAMDANADLSIEYEYAPFLAVQKKTLLGLRAEYEWSRDLKFGSTLLYKSDKAQDRKPRVGQETAKMFLADFDVDFKLYPGFMTKAVDALPGVATDRESIMSVSAEVAQSRPNPNVDNVAYIDDFEASHEKLDVGKTRLTWTKSSKPENLGPGEWQRGKILWHTPYNLPRRDDVYDIEVGQRDAVLRTLRFIYRPKNVKENYVINEVIDHIDTTIINDTTLQIDTTFIADTVGVDTTTVNSWAGVMRYFGSRVDESRAQLLEIRLRHGANGPSGRLHLDFGFITEDVNGDGISFGEDDYAFGGNENRVVDEYETANGVIIDEDTGLDGLLDPEEPGYDPATNPDPDGDNWYFLGEGKCPVPAVECNSAQFQARIEDPDDPLYYEWLNGTEGNRDDIAAAARPDEERLTDQFIERNDYFSFLLDFDNNPDSFKVEGSEKNGWVTYRIPIRDTAAVHDIVGSPKWNNIQHVRVWFDSDANDNVEDTLEIADWYFVQTNWNDSVIVNPSLPPGEPDLVVATVSTEDGTFVPPPGVKPYEDPTENVEEAQRGLALQYKDIRPGDTALASRELVTAESYSGYRLLEMYVYADDQAAADSVGFFFRMGRDSVNFYEFHLPADLYAGWDERNYVTIDFNAITALKDAALRNQRQGTAIDTSDLIYRVKGAPNLNQIRWFAVGIVNLDSSSASRATGEVWIDELRLTEVRRDVGTAGRISVSGNAADLINYGFTYQAKDPYFRGISAATRGGSNNNLGSGQTEKNLNWNASVALEKFTPRSWSARLPFSVSYARTSQLPLLRTNSDIVLPEDIRKQEESISESRSFRVAESFGKQTKNPLFNLFLNRQEFSFSYTRSTRSSVNQPYYLGENYTISGTFDASWQKPPSVPIFFWTRSIPIVKKTAGNRLGLYPNSLRFQGQLNRVLSISEDADRRRVTSLKKDFSGTVNMRYQLLSNLGTTFKYTTRRDLTDPETVNIVLSPSKFRLGLETNYAQSFAADYDPQLLTFFTTKFSYSANYTDNWERSSKSRKGDMSRQWGVGGQFDHMRLFSLTSGGGASPGRGRRSSQQGGGTPFYDLPFAGLRFLTGWIKPIAYKYSESYNISLPGLTNRPNMRFRFGIDKSSDVPRIDEPRQPFSSEGRSYDLSSGFTLLGGIRTDVRYRRALTRDLITVGTRREQISTSWPDLSIAISQFSTLPLIKGIVNKFISVFSPRTGYSRDIKETRNLDNNILETENETISHNPLLSVNFRLLRSFSLSGSYTLTKTKSARYNTVTGEEDNRQRSNKKSMAFSGKYSFTAPGGIGIPLFGKVKFRSTVALELNVRFTRDLVENSTRGRPFSVTSDRSDFTVSPVISYAFSQQIKGGVTATWQDTNDQQQNRKRHVRELQIWAEIRF